MPEIIEVGDRVRSKDGKYEGQLFTLHDPKKKEDVTSSGTRFRYDDDKRGMWRDLAGAKLVAKLWRDNWKCNRSIPFEELVLVCKRRHCRGCTSSYWSTDKRALYCSTNCRKKNARVFHPCEKCGSKFERQRTNQKFCSRTCKENAARNRRRHPGRSGEIERLGGACSVCSGTEKLRIVDGGLLCGKHHVERNQQGHRERTGTTKTGKDQLSAFNRLVRVTLVALEDLEEDDAQQYLQNVCARLNPTQTAYLMSKIRLSSKGGVLKSL